MKTLLITTIMSFLLLAVALSEDPPYVKDKIYVLIGTPDNIHADGSIILSGLRVYLPGGKEDRAAEDSLEDCYLLDAPDAYKQEAQNSKHKKEVKCLAKYVGIDIFKSPGFSVGLKTLIFRFIRESK